MQVDKRIYTLNIKFNYIILASIIGIANSILCYSRLYSMVMVAIECMILLFFLVTGRYFEYASYYIVFLTMSLEYGIYYGSQEIFGFRESRLLGVGIATIAIIPLVIIGILKTRINILKIKMSDSKVIKFSKFIYWIFIIGFILGIFQILINDNDIQRMNSLWNIFLGEVYTYIILLVFPLIAYIFIIIYYSEKIEELKSIVFSILLGIVVSQFFCFLTPYKGTTWKSTTLLVTFAAFYVPLLFCFVFYFNNYKARVPLLLIGLLGTLFSGIFTVTSGGLLVVFFVPGLILLILKEQGENVSMLFWAMLFCIALVIGVSFVNIILNNANILFEYKLSQALSLLKIWEPGWYTKLPPSAKFRFQELSNIVHEYIRKPYYVLFGKGIMGTCLDYNHTFMATNYVGEGGFLKEEWEIEAFFSMHESLNVLFLSSGMYGIYFLVWTIKNCVMNLYKSPFLTIGLLYILFHYTYSFTASNFGLICLLIGLYEIDKFKVDLICQ